jgi:hypothetical protein
MGTRIKAGSKVWVRDYQTLTGIVGCGEVVSVDGPVRESRKVGKVVPCTVEIGERTMTRLIREDDLSTCP